MANIFVGVGDITQTMDVDAIVMLFNPNRTWPDSLDLAIQRIAGDLYHAQVAEAVFVQGLRNGQVVIAKGNHAHRGSFNDVVFVVDELQSPLNELVYAALQNAKREGYTSIVLPLIWRAGVMLGVVEPNVEVVCQEMRLGLDRFFEEGDVNIEIYIVAPGYPEADELLKRLR